VGPGANAQRWAPLTRDTQKGIKGVLNPTFRLFSFELNKK